MEKQRGVFFYDSGKWWRGMTAEESGDLGRDQIIKNMWVDSMCLTFSHRSRRSVILN